jgi:hypothetical protein
MIDISTVLDRPERIPNTDDPKEVGGLKITFGLDLDGRHHRDQRYRIYRKKSPSSYQDDSFLLKVPGHIVYREFLQNAASIKPRFYTRYREVPDAADASEITALELTYRNETLNISVSLRSMELLSSDRLHEAMSLLAEEMESKGRRRVSGTAPVDVEANWL